jgi:Lon-like ATP-dependent protease
MSLALNTPVSQDIAMTGEITLMGKVLPIGGVKEKVLAAQREGIKKVILPKQNERDFAKLPDFLKKNIEVCYADNYTEVFQILFPNMQSP